MNKQTLFISYNWRDGNTYADELETQLGDEFDVKRDKSQLIANDDIYDFMAEIIKCDNVIIVLTAEYVKSLNCMLEMSYMFEQPDWKTKVTVLVIDESLYSTERKLEIINYWMLRQKKCELSIQQFDSGIQILEDEQGYIEQICEQVEKFFVGITRRKNPSQIAIVNEVIKKAKSDKETKEEIVEELTEREKQVLEIIAENKDITIKELSERTALSTMAAQRFISQLRDKGAVEIVASGRQRKYRLSEQ